MLVPLEAKYAKDSCSLRDDPETWRYRDCDTPLPATEESEASYYETCLTDKTMSCQAILCGTEYAGNAFIRKITNGTAELSYYILRKESRGIGVGTETVRQLLEICFFEIGVDLVYLWTDNSNLANIRIAEKLGFYKAGESYPERGKSRYEMTRTMWAAANSSHDTVDGIRKAYGDGAIKKANYAITYLLPQVKAMNERHLCKTKNANPTNEIQRKSIEEYWKSFMPELDVSCSMYFDFYNAFEKDPGKVKHYIPDSLFYMFVDEWFTNPIRSRWIDDKNLYWMLFYDCPMPDVVFRKIGDMYLDSSFRTISEEIAVARCLECDEVVMKVPAMSFGGKGVKFIDCRKAKKRGVMDAIEGFRPEGSARERVDILCEKTVRQHHLLDSINSSSVNTIRMITLVGDNGECDVLSSVLRMGVNGSRCDNASNGGIFCGISDNGILKDIAYNVEGDRFTMHPSGGKFAGIEIPNFHMFIEMSKGLAMRFVSASRMISWDWAVGIDGYPVLIEMNITDGEIDFHQMCNGPIFGSRTAEVLSVIRERSVTYKQFASWINTMLR